MKKYKTTSYKGMYQVVDDGKLKYPCFSLKKTKNSAGMTYTAAKKALKSFERSNIADLTLYGTFDKLGNKVRAQVVALDCPCCGTKGKGKLVLKKNLDKFLKANL